MALVGGIFISVSYSLVSSIDLEAQRSIGPGEVDIYISTCEILIAGFWSNQLSLGFYADIM